MGSTRTPPRIYSIRAASLLMWGGLLGACNEAPSSGETAPPNNPQPSATTTTTAVTKPPPPTASATSSSKATPAPPGWGDRTQWTGTLAEQNALLFEQIAHFHKPTGEQLEQIEKIFAASSRLGQGNPKAARHPMSPDACREKLAETKTRYEDRSAEATCGGPYMAPLYDPTKETAKDARVCIDRFEFPNIPCVYPVTWVSAREAVQICQALGKRLCDAHEWEGACAGQLTPPDYDFSLAKRMKQADALRTMRKRHNHLIEKSKRWAYGSEYQKGICATGSRKSKRCGVGWRKCGTNTYPAGAFPKCVSPLGVYDIHGNAAEHMNLPVLAEQMASSPSQKYGHTEMKGSWFVFDQIRAHKDHCRWRAPYWHGNRVMSKGSHQNYHLGFRCCKSIGEANAEPSLDPK
ncbi:MAG: SUMF1/EgtB/PvdO family nonheme iron enzyme [Polyangiaceae bacterium]